MKISRRLRVVAGLLVALLLAGGVAYTVFNNRDKGLDRYDDPTVTPSTSADTPATSSDGSTRRVTLYMDGWTKATIGDAQLTVSPIDVSKSLLPGSVNQDQQVTAANQNLLLSAVRESDLVKLVADKPDLVNRVAARLVNADNDLRCSTGGCTSGAGNFPLENITSPEKIESLGASYKNYGIASGLWSGQVNIPKDSTGFVLSIDGWNGGKFYLVDKPDVSESDIKYAPEPDPSNGYYDGTFIVAGGLGKFFNLSPAWITDDPAAEYRETIIASGAEQTNLVDAAAEPLFSSGLRVPTRWVEGLNDSQLTFMTSPTTGCGVGVLCVPDRLDNNIKDYTFDAVNVCDASGKQAVLLIQTSTWNFDLSGPTSLYGAWNGKNPEQFENAKGTSAVYAGNAPLVEGKTELKESMAYVFDQRRGTTLAAKAGSMAQVGVDDEDAVNRELDRADLKQLFDGSYSLCQN